MNNYLDGTYNKNQILYLRCQNEKQKETKTKKKKKNKKQLNNQLAYFISGRGLLIISGSWRTLFMRGVLMACEH